MTTKIKPFPKMVVSLGFLLVCVAGVFSPSLDNGFLNWDDDAYVTANPRVKDFSIEKIPRFFTSLERVQYKPLSFLFFALEYRFFEMRPRGYHAVSLVLHLVNTALVFWLFFLLRRDHAIAWLVALLFGLHPLRVESVAWVTEQKDLLYGFFFLAASLCYLYHRIRCRRRYYYFSLVFFICSLLAKPMLLAFPLILFGFDAMRFGDRPLSEKWRGKVPFFLVSFSAAVANYLSLSWHHQEHVLSFSLIEWANRLNFYVAKIFWPMRLSGFYPYVPQESPSFFSVVWAIFFAICFVLVFWIFRKRKGLVFGASFFILSVCPVLLERGAFVVADRYVYIAALGLFYLAAEGLRQVVRARPGPVVKGVVLAAGVVVIGFFCVLTFQRTKVWHDSLTFWEDVLRKYPGSYLALNNRGDAYLQAGAYEKAIIDFTAATNVDPTKSPTYVNLCNAHIFLGKQVQALAFCNKAIALDPENPLAYFNIGNAYADLGKYEEAILAYNKAIEIKKDYADVYQNLGTVYSALKRPDEAEKLFRRALEIDSTSLEARYNLAVIYFDEKKYDLAIKYCDEAMKLGYKPDEDFLEVLRPYRRKGDGPLAAGI